MNCHEWWAFQARNGNGTVVRGAAIAVSGMEGGIVGSEPRWAGIVADFDHDVERFKTGLAAMVGAGSAVRPVRPPRSV